MRCGVLALQGDFEKHAETLRYLGHSVLYIKKAEHLSGLDFLVMPGGESTALLKLLSPQFFEELQTTIRQGLPVFATCAGLILLATQVTNPKQASLNTLDVTVERNSYGSQVESAVIDQVPWTDAGKKLLTSHALPISDNEIILIRAPRITRVGPDVNVLIQHDSDPLLVQSENILAASFHPELSGEPYDLYKTIIGLLTGQDAEF